MEVNLKLRNIEARRFSHSANPAKINNNSTVTNLAASEESLTVGFIFTSNYEPNVGMIRIEGDLELSASGLDAHQVVSEWEASNRKKLPSHVAEKIHNSILSTCMVEATILSRDIHLPTPIPTPRIAINGISEEEKKDTDAYIR
ncbi:hypothetical protein ACFLRC_02490 [Candidatus Altiarchaeota archaeon]